MEYVIYYDDVAFLSLCTCVGNYFTDNRVLFGFYETDNFFLVGNS